MMRRRKWERLRQAALFLLPIAAASVVLLFAAVLNTMDADRCALGAALQEQAGLVREFESDSVQLFLVILFHGKHLFGNYITLLRD